MTPSRHKGFLDRLIVKEGDGPNGSKDQSLGGACVAPERREIEVFPTARDGHFGPFKHRSGTPAERADPAYPCGCIRYDSGHPSVYLALEDNGSLICVDSRHILGIFVGGADLRRRFNKA